MFETHLIEALLHGTLELVGNLSISVSVEYSPLVHGWLTEHLGLSLAVELSGTLLNVDLVRSTRTGWTQDEVASIVLVSTELRRDVLELDVPSLGLLFAFLVLGERLEQMRALLDLLLGVGVNNLCEVLHESEVGSHLIGQTCELTELWNKCHFVTSLAVLVDEERLVDIGDALIVPGLVVLHVADLGAVLVECCLWRHVELDPFDLVSFLIVPEEKSKMNFKFREKKMNVLTW